MSAGPFPASQSDEPHGRSLWAVDVAALPRAAMRARRHPEMLFGLWTWQVAFSLVVSGPAAALVHATYGAHPRGDQPLWEPGGRALLDFLSRNTHGLAALIREAEIVLVVGALGGLVPMAAAMFAMAHAQRDGRPVGCVRCIAAALQALPKLAALLAAVAVAQAIAIGTGVVAAGALQSSLHEMAGEALAQQLQAAVGLGFLAVAAAFGVVHDLARAAVVRFHVTARRGLGMGLRAFCRAPTGLSWSWGWRALASLAPIAMAGEIEGRIREEGYVVALIALHQAVAVMRIAFRVSWLAKALRSLRRSDVASALPH